MRRRGRKKQARQEGRRGNVAVYALVGTVAGSPELPYTACVRRENGRIMAKQEHHSLSTIKTEPPCAVDREGSEKALDAGLEDSFPASDPIAAVQPTLSVKESTCERMLIRRHDKSDVVELSDGSKWRIWPGDLPITLQWLPTTEIAISEIRDEFCSHVLIDQFQGSQVRVIEASNTWPVKEVQQALKDG